MVASADALASQAGLELLRRGGTAVDAAVGANAVLAVTAPHLCGLGGDLFALVHPGGATGPLALNASGRAGRGADPDRLRAEGVDEMPFRGDVRSVTVPGCVDGWAALHGRFGRLPLTEVLSSAIGYAEAGFPASPLLVASAKRLPSPLPEGAEEYAGLSRSGQRLRRPGAARTLRAIATSGRDGFYGGEFGAGLLRLGADEFTDADLASPSATWVTPLTTSAWDHALWTVPPNSQGYLTLAGAWIADRLGLPEEPADGAWVVALVEAALAAGRDRPDVLSESADGAALLGEERLSRLVRSAGSGGDGAWAARALRGDDTTYLCAVDEGGMGVSLIQSNASGFGSFLFEPRTGINLHNRGIGFTLSPGHPAEYGPRRRPPHTLAPALVTRLDGSLAAIVGTQGGDGQPQILLQVLARWLRSAETPGRAIGSPRWVLSGTGQGFDTWTAAGGPVVVVEEGAPAGWEHALRARGHSVRSGPAYDHGFGHANLIVRSDDGMLAGAADPRARIAATAGY